MNHKAPFPYFGGKASIAEDVWAALGQPSHYIEPFFGSGAVLLNRPDFNAQTHMETVCDADGHLANVWRSLQAEPDTVAKWCDWPVNHADLIARKKRLNEQTDSLLERLCADDTYYDAKLAGYWVWSASCWIGHGLICPNARPHISEGGKGVHAKGKSGNSNTEANVQEPYNTNLYQWFRELSERLRRVRVVCGDWTRVCGGNWQTNLGACGIFFDPPYSDVAERNAGLYSIDSLDVAHDVRAWCMDRGDDKDYRIVLAGYFDEHKELLDRNWTVKKWSAQGGYGKIATNDDTQGNRNRHKEALFFSPHCLGLPLFA